MFSGIRLERLRLLASTCAVLSPMIFTWFRPDPRKTSKSAQLAEATKESLLDESLGPISRSLSTSTEPLPDSTSLCT